MSEAGVGVRPESWTAQLRRMLPRPAELRRQEEELARRNPLLARAQEEEKRQGQLLAVRARTAALIATGALLLWINPRFEVVYYLAILGLFVALGLAQLRYARVGQSRVELALILGDLILLTFTLVAPNPLAQEQWPTAVQYRFEGFIYFFIFLAGSTLAYSWRTVQTLAFACAVIWLAGAGLVYWFGTTMPQLSTGVEAALEGYPRLFGFLDPNSVRFDSRVQEVVVFTIVAFILALKARRSNEMLIRQATIAAERANLSRYFPPTMVDELALRNEPMGRERSQEVAVLFADIVGFTRMAEAMTPADTIATLREFHAVIEDAVFSNRGTLDKYLGDGVMASFGTPQTTPDDAANAIAAAFAMHEGVKRLNMTRGARGLEPIRLSVGVHFGPVVLGDIGSERRMEFAMLGDTVNVASRLESATRETGASIVVAQAVLDAMQNAALREYWQSRFAGRSEKVLRGRSGTIAVWEF